MEKSPEKETFPSADGGPAAGADIEWQAAFDAIPAVVLLMDMERRIIRANKMTEVLLKQAVASVVGKTCKEVIPNCPLSGTGVVPARKTAQVEVAGKWLDIVTDPIPTQTGRCERFVCILTDATERRRAEMLLREKEAQYRSLFEKNIAVMFLIRPGTGEIVDANPAALRYYGYPHDKMSAMNISDVNIMPREAVHQEMVLARTEQRNYFNFRHRLANGEIRDVEVYSGPIIMNSETLLCSIVHDISGRKAAEVERERLIRKLQRALGEIKTLSGLIPICARCKKIRDDTGYWNQLEDYFQAHSKALFTHGLCPGCQDEMYGKEDWYIDMKQTGDDRDKGTD